MKALKCQRRLKKGRRGKANADHFGKKRYVSLLGLLISREKEKRIILRTA